MVSTIGATLLVSAVRRLFGYTLNSDSSRMNLTGAPTSSVASVDRLAKPRARGSRKTDYYPWFDWLRLGLACTVMVSHSGLLWSQAGNFAVQVFFALSGWLIGGILLQLREDELPRFYFNRALRIWCPYFLALGLLITASLTLRDTPTYKWSEFVFYKSTFVYNLFGPPQLAQHQAEMPLAGTGNHFWSVNAEEQFYLAGAADPGAGAPAVWPQGLHLGRSRRGGMANSNVRQYCVWSACRRSRKCLRQSVFARCQPVSGRIRSPSLWHWLRGRRELRVVVADLRHRDGAPARRPWRTTSLGPAGWRNVLPALPECVGSRLCGERDLQEI